MYLHLKSCKNTFKACDNDLCSILFGGTASTWCLPIPLCTPLYVFASAMPGISLQIMFFTLS